MRMRTSTGLRVLFCLGGLLILRFCSHYYFVFFQSNESFCIMLLKTGLTYALDCRNGVEETKGV